MIEQILSRFEWVQRSGDGWRAKCPAHETHNRSLRVDIGESRVLFYCYAGCRQDAILEAVGLEWRDVLLTSPPRLDGVDLRRRKTTSEKKPLLTREEIEYQHDYGTMSEGQYQYELRRWATGFGRTTVVYDETGEVERYELH